MEKSFFLILLQIVMESLPVSSSGHVLVLAKILYLSIESVLFVMLDYLSHAATAFCVLIVFRREWFAIVKRFFCFCPSRSGYLVFLRLIFRISLFVFIADFITVLFYIVVSFWVMRSLWLLLFGFIVTGASLLSLFFLRKEGRYGAQPPAEVLDFYKAFLIGCAQGISLLPGISRFGSTYVAARWLKISPRRAIQFSFLIQVPLIGVAFLGALRKLSLSGSISLLYSVEIWFFVIIATIIACFALRFAYVCALGRKFWYFGFYMIFPCLAVIWLIIRC